MNNIFNSRTLFSLFLFIIFIFITNMISLFRHFYINITKRKYDDEYYLSRQFYHRDKFSFYTNYFSAYFALMIICIFFITNNSSTISNENDISERINTISSNLEETSKELSSIQQSLESRVDYVESLKEEAEIAENVISLSEEQVNAVQSKINQELNASNGRNTIISFMINAFFFTLGLVIHPIINFIKHKNSNKDTNKNVENKKYSQEELLNLLMKSIHENNNDASSNDK